MPADPLDGWKIDTGLYEVGDGGVAHDGWRDKLGIEACGDDGSPKWLTHPVTVASKACTRARGGEYPADTIVRHITLSLEDRR